MLKEYLIEYSVNSSDDTLLFKVPYTKLFEYSKANGYTVSYESLELIAQEFAWSIIRDVIGIDLQPVKIELTDIVQQDGLIAREFNFGDNSFTCLAKEPVIDFLTEQLQLRPLNLAKVAPLKINYTIKIFRRQYLFNSTQYLYTPQVRQMYLAVITVVDGMVVKLYLNRVLIHKLYTEYYASSGFGTYYEISPLIGLAQLLELWLRDEYDLEINIEQIKLVYIKNGYYLKIDCFMDGNFCGYILSDSYHSLPAINKITQVDNGVADDLNQDLIEGLWLRFPLNIGSTELSMSDIENLVPGDVVMIDSYSDGENKLLYLDLGKTGFITELNQNRLKLLDLK